MIRPARLSGAWLLGVDPEGPNADRVSPGLLGFITVFCLALALVLLVRSMTKHLRKVRYSPGPDGKPWVPPGTPGATGPGTADRTDSAEGTGAPAGGSPPTSEG